MFDLNHQNPDPKVAKSHDGQRDNEVDDHHCDSVRCAHRLGKGARVNPGVILQGANKEVWHNGHHRERPGQADIAAGVLQVEELIIPKAVADVAVAVDRNCSDVENRPDDAQAHQEPTDLAVNVSHSPSIMENGTQDQRIRIHRHYQVCDRQADDKDVAYEKGQETMKVSTDLTGSFQLRAPLQPHCSQPSLHLTFRV